MRISLTRPLILLLGALFLVNLLQAFSTELIYDEAYYWYYAQNPAWGYFDHPPMVAWMINAGIWLVDNELGVRLLSCLMGTGTFILLWVLTDHPEKQKYHRQFFIWILSITLLHAYGFLILPDTPLIFFTALFLLIYRNFLKKPGYWIAVALGMSMAALMYCKYHAALVILLILLSNISLLRNRFAWMALAVSLFFYAPHLAWLYENDFISVKFHLFERPNQPYSFTKFTLGFLLNLVALFGLTFPWAYKVLFRFRPGNDFEKALLFLGWGFLIFFFISSFQRRIQTQWLIVVCIPVAILVAKRLMEDPILRKWIWRASLVNVVVLFLLRAGLVYEPLFPVPFEAHGNKRWVGNLEKVSNGAPVVFENSYRRASMYAFYSRKTALSFDNAHYRKDQYFIDGSEARVQGKKVFYVPKGGRVTGLYYLNASGQKLYGYFIENFESFRSLEAGFPKNLPLEPDQEYELWVYNPYDENIPLSKLRFAVAYLDKHKRLEEIKPLLNIHPNTGLLPARDSLLLNVMLSGPENTDPEYARAVISENGLSWGINGSAQPINP